MKTTKYIASFLYFVVLFCFIVTSVYFIIAHSAIFFGKDGQYIYKYDDNSWTTIGSKNSEGSLVPVKLTLQISDSIRKTNNNYFGTIAEDSYPRVNNLFLKENKKVKAINIYDVTPSDMEDHTFGTDEGGNYKNRSTFQFIKYVNGGDSQYLRIKTKDTSTNIILALRDSLNFLFDILEMYFLALILKEVAKEIYFSKVLSKYIAKLGYLMLLSQLVSIIYAFIDIKLFGNIRVRPQILESLKNGYFENIEVYFNPTIDINIYIVLLGAVLVLFTKLVERGRALEEENELTI
ncbi:MAG: hypothetical protein V4572_11085 [Bacteroidota bacterium]